MESKVKVRKPPRPPQLIKFMHPRNPYKFVSFKELATAYPEFRAFCSYDISGKIFFDFKNKQALKSLLTSLLDRDFGLKLNVRDDRLVPTLPLRMNYLLWIEDLLTLLNAKLNQKKSVTGIDIGTGSVPIYPLLGSKKFGWNFIGTETDELSFSNAQKNVEDNNMESTILLQKSPDLFHVLKLEEVQEFIKRVKANDATDSLANLSLKTSNNGRMSDDFLVDFTVCNPPFYSSEEEMDTNFNSKKETRSQPVSVSTGSLDEKVTDGGEVAFISRLIDMSLLYKSQIRIFTTLIGKKSDLKTVTKLIKEKTAGHFVRIAETDFCQGRTMRWGVAWTFDAATPLERVFSKKQKLSQKPLVLNFRRTQMTSYTVKSVWAKIVSWLRDIKIKPVLFKSKGNYIGAIIRAYKETWLNQRKKRREKGRHISASMSECKGKRGNDTGTDETSPKRFKLDVGEDNLSSIANTTKVSNACEGNIFESCSAASSSKIEECTEMEYLSSDNTAKEDGSGYYTDIANISGDCTDVANLSGDSTNMAEIGDACTALATKGDDCTAVPNFGADTTEITNIAGNSTEMERETSETAKKHGLECVLKCALHLKQTEALISLEINFQSGKGGKEAMNRLMQYLKNRLEKGD